MINSFVFDTIMARLAGRTAPALRAKIVGELEVTIRELERGPWKPWFLEGGTGGDLVVDAVNFALPDDFLEEVEEGAFNISTVDGVWNDPTPVKVPFEFLERTMDNADSGVPEMYAIYGDSLYLGPPPDLAYPYKLRYFRRTTPVPDDGDTITNKWLLEFFDYVTLACAKKVALTHLQSQEMATKMNPELSIAYDRFWRAVESRKHANVQYLLGNVED